MFSKATFLIYTKRGFNNHLSISIVGPTVDYALFLSPSPVGDHVNVSSAEWLLLKTIWLVTHGGAWAFLSNQKDPFNALSFHFSKLKCIREQGVYQRIKSESEVVVMLPFLQKSFVFNTIDLIVVRVHKDDTNVRLIS